MSAREFDLCEIRRNRWRPTIKCTPFRINSAGPHQRRSFKWERLTVPLIFSRSYSTTNLQLFHQGSQFGPISVNTSPMKAMSGVLESYHRALSIMRIIRLTGARFTNRSCLGLGCARADMRTSNNNNITLWVPLPPVGSLHPTFSHVQTKPSPSHPPNISPIELICQAVVLKWYHHEWENS